MQTSEVCLFHYERHSHFGCFLLYRRQGGKSTTPLKDLAHNNAAKPTPKGTDFTAHSDKKYYAIEYSRQNIIHFDFSIDIQ